MTPGAAHVLLVEDDETLGGLLSVHLRARGYQVTVAQTAESATDLLENGISPDIVVDDAQATWTGRSGPGHATAAEAMRPVAAPIGMAKPMPSLLDAIAVLMAMTRPARSTSRN